MVRSCFGFYLFEERRKSFRIDMNLGVILMRNKIINIGILLVVMVAMTGIAVAQKTETQFCHVPPGNPKQATTHDITNGNLNGHLDDNGELHGLDYYGPCTTSETHVPEFPTIALPIAAIIGLVLLLFQYGKK